MGDFEEPRVLLEKSRGNSPVLGACRISDAEITRIPADEETLYIMLLCMPLLLLLLLLLLLD